MLSEALIPIRGVLGRAMAPWLPLMILVDDGVTPTPWTDPETDDRQDRCVVVDKGTPQEEVFKVFRMGSCGRSRRFRVEGGQRGTTPCNHRLGTPVEEA